MFALPLSALIVLVCLASAPTLAAPMVQVIERGVPTDGTRVMTGYRGFVLRVVSDGAPINSIALNGLPPLDRGTDGILGDLAQRWTDPTGSGNYTVTSPGPIDADNTVPSAFNFDTHFLPDVAAGIRSPSPAAAPMETAGPFDKPNRFSTAGNPIPSDPFIGYGDFPDGFAPAVNAEFYETALLGRFVFPDPPQAVDLAYVVTNSSFQYGLEVQLTDFSGGTIFGVVTVPEPSGMAAIMVGLAGLLRGKRRSVRHVNCRACQLETLEPRRMLSISPSDLLLTAAPITGGVQLQWPAVDNSATKPIYIARKSPNAAGPAAWQQVGSITSPGATSFDDATAGVGSAYEYRATFLGNTKYILAGNAVPAVESRGTTVFVVDETLLVPSNFGGATFQPALDRLKADLIGEGYKVRVVTAPRVDVPRVSLTDTSPSNINAVFGTWRNAVQTTKNSIRQVWDSAGDLSNVLLIGHVAVPYSGITAIDGHSPNEHEGAWVADDFYSTLSVPDSVWTSRDTASVTTSGYSSVQNRNYPGDGKFDLDSLQQLDADPNQPGNQPVFSDVAIGRIDFSMLDLNFDGVGGADMPAAARRG